MRLLRKHEGHAEADPGRLADVEQATISLGLAHSAFLELRQVRQRIKGFAPAAANSCLKGLHAAQGFSRGPALLGGPARGGGTQSDGSM